MRVLVIELPTIAQLVERPTVEDTQLSGGPWFESGLSDLFLSGDTHVATGFSRVYELSD